MSREQETPDGRTDGGAPPEATRPSAAVRADGGSAVADGGAETGDGIVREIGHDEFDPVGTLTLILGYLAILVVMWLFMYFVEFLGNGPTVVG